MSCNSFATVAAAFIPLTPPFGGVPQAGCGIPGIIGRAARSPILPCAGLGLSCRSHYCLRGGLLPRLFTLTSRRRRFCFCDTFRPYGMSPVQPALSRGIPPCGVRTFLSKLPKELQAKAFAREPVKRSRYARMQPHASQTAHAILSSLKYGGCQMSLPAKFANALSTAHITGARTPFARSCRKKSAWWAHFSNRPHRCPKRGYGSRNTHDFE